MSSTADKQKVRNWQQQRAQEHKPPPSPDDIRRQLGFHLIPKNKSTDGI